MKNILSSICIRAKNEKTVQGMYNCLELLYEAKGIIPDHHYNFGVEYIEELIQKRMLEIKNKAFAIFQQLP